MNRSFQTKAVVGVKVIYIPWLIKVILSLPVMLVTKGEEINFYVGGKGVLIFSI